MLAILHHRTSDAIPLTHISLFQFTSDKTKDVDHEYTGRYSLAHNSGFPRHKRRRIANQINYSGEIT